MNMIALNTIAQPRQTKRSTVKVKAPIATKSNIDVKPAVSAKHSDHILTTLNRRTNSSPISVLCGIAARRFAGLSDIAMTLSKSGLQV